MYSDSDDEKVTSITLISEYKSLDSSKRAFLNNKLFIKIRIYLIYNQKIISLMAVITTTDLLTNATYQKSVGKKSTKFYSAKLLNWVEPVEIGGYQKTVFYSETSTNFNVGDRVFILNGNYDSNEKIRGDKYSLYSDGYRVLGVDGCRIILDIDYTGLNPYEKANTEDYIKVTHIKNQREFDFINNVYIPIKTSQFTNLNDNIYNKYSGKVNGLTASLWANEIIFASDVFSGGVASGIAYDSITSAGFWMRDENSTPKQWVNITSQFLDNRLESINPDFTNNGRIFVIGEDFTYNGLTYKQRLAYERDSGIWVADTQYLPPVISKLNFRYGNFKGKHNDGIFGSELKSAFWDGKGDWNYGVLVNSNWNSGTMNSKSVSGEEIYYSKLKNITGTTTSVPVQFSNTSNNNGIGLNLSIDSNINGGTIQTGEFYNCNIGYSSTFSAIDSYLSVTQSAKVTVNNGRYTFCDIDSVNLNNSVLTNVNVNNTVIGNSKVINSQLIDTAIYKSEFNSDSGIKILAADLWSYDILTYSVATSSSTTIRGMIKLFISDEDANKLIIGDSIYITKINKEWVLSSLSTDERIKLPIETKFILDSYLDTEFSTSNIVVNLKSKDDNKYKVAVTKGIGDVSFNVLTTNPYYYSSIDIDCQQFGWYYNGDSTAYTSSFDHLNVVYLDNYNLNPITLKNINNVFLNNFITDSDFKSGYMYDSKWISGGNINYRQNKINHLTSDTLNIYTDYVSNPNSLYIETNYDPLNTSFNVKGYDLFVGDNIWLNGVDYVYGLTSVSLDGRYKVVSVTNLGSTVKVETLPIDNTLVTQINTLYGGDFKVVGAEKNTYVSINKFLINSSTVNSGLFKRTSILNSEFINTEFNNLDKDITFSNTDKLRIINGLFKRGTNTIKNGLFYKSHFIKSNFLDGIVYNSVWNGATFSNGILNSIYWVGGSFENGSFLNNNSTYSVALDYDLEPRYKLWYNGTFDGGDFFNSIWANGTFNNGRFYKSNWFGGVWNNGILGSTNLSSLDTLMSYNLPLSFGATYTRWNDGIVENATIGGSGIVYWYGGEFRNGEFTSYGSNISNESIWYNGIFNGGKITELARWKNGTFNKGKFLSHYGYELASPTNSSTYSTDYGWETGIFNGGVFGNAETGTNSVWYNGNFNGGVFQGRLWYNGVFLNGSFVGSGSTSSTMDGFVQSFANSYYGLWNNGWVTDRPNLVRVNDRFYTELVRIVDEKSILNSANLKNVLWLSGTFSHNLGIIDSSIWLDGEFVKGSFVNSTFNPYVDRTFSGSSQSSFNYNPTCVWTGGKFDGGTFYISEWKQGTFESGEMIGGIWRNGTWNYGKATNIYWQNGRWRNGLWNGSPFLAQTATQSGDVVDSIIDSNNNIINGFEHEILTNVGTMRGTSSIHIINVFSGTQSSQYLVDPNLDASPRFATPTSLLTNVSLFTDPTELRADWTSADVYYDYREYPFSSAILTTYNDKHVLISSTTSQSDYLYFWDDPTGAGWTTSVLQQPSGWVYSPESVNYDIVINWVVAPNYHIYSGSPSPTDNTGTIRVNYGPSSSTFTLNCTSLGGSIPFGSPFVNYLSARGTINLSISDLNLSSNRKVSIQKTSGKADVLITGVSLRARRIQYDVLNNTLYPTSPNLLTSGSTMSIPSNLILSAISNAGGQFYSIPLTFGNGIFKSGIWENGVWNNGYRSDDYSRPFILSQSFQESEKIWLISLVGLGDDDYVTDTMGMFGAGDKISVGNIIALDINGDRKIIYDTFKIRSINGVQMICEVTINFPIRSIEIDTVDNQSFSYTIRSNYKFQSTHINYVTKNVWLSGVFLNGYFSGVWNNGLVKGRPYLTKFENVHWLDGTLNGGQIKGFTSSISYDVVSSITSAKNVIETNYNTDGNGSVFYNQSLIQKMTFFDNNDASTYKFRFNSWINLNWNNENQSNVYQDTNYYDVGTQWSTDTTLSKANLNGFITYDILSSNSYFRNGYDSTVNSYSLGVKYKKYTDYLEGVGDFTKMFSNDTNSYPRLNMSTFIDDEWSVKSRILDFYSGTNNEAGFDTDNPNGYDEGDLEYKYYIMSTPVYLSVGSETGWGHFYPSKFKVTNIDNSLYIQSSDVVTIGTYSTEHSWSTALPSGTSDLHNLIILDNERTKQIPDKRYSMIEFTLQSFTGFPGPQPFSSRDKVDGGSWVPPSLYWGIPPATWSIVQYMNNPLYTKVGDSFTYTPPGTVKREFFYNRHSLLLQILANHYATSPGLPYATYPVNAKFDNMHFYELDMIPFFMYATESSINQNIQAPYYVSTVPRIQYDNSDFVYVNNVVITLSDSQITRSTTTITSPITSLSAVAASSGGVF